LLHKYEQNWFLWNTLLVDDHIFLQVPHDACLPNFAESFAIGSNVAEFNPANIPGKTPAKKPTTLEVEKETESKVGTMAPKGDSHQAVGGQRGLAKVRELSKGTFESCSLQSGGQISEKPDILIFVHLFGAVSGDLDRGGDPAICGVKPAKDFAKSGELLTLACLDTPQMIATLHMNISFSRL